MPGSLRRGALRRCYAEVILIDRRNHHIFQPLLYQVATAVLAPADVAAPIRQIEDKQKNLTVMCPRWLKALSKWLRSLMFG